MEWQKLDFVVEGSEGNSHKAHLHHPIQGGGGPGVMRHKEKYESDKIWQGSRKPSVSKWW